MPQTELFIWNETFNTGIIAVDRQHQTLVDMINEAVRLSFRGITMSCGEIGPLRASLEQYVRRHFTTEERIMARYAVDVRHLNAHVAAHRAFSDKITAFFSGKDSVTGDQLGEFTEFLIRWLAYHILNTDKAFARQTIVIKAGMTPADAYETASVDGDENAEPLLKALRTLFFMVSEKNAELERANAELEHKVRQRTAELQDANNKLSHLAMEDELTGLPNRRYALATLSRFFGEWKRFGSPVAVLMIDADHFKTVNDTRGHEYGDRVLVWIADFLRSNTRQTDVVCRLGGDEFLVICPRSTLADAEFLARKTVERAKEFNEKTPLEYWQVSLSIGIAASGTETGDFRELVAHADAAMYKSKEAGGNRVSAAGE